MTSPMEHHSAHCSSGSVSRVLAVVICLLWAVGAIHQAQAASELRVVPDEFVRGAAQSDAPKQPSIAGGAEQKDTAAPEESAVASDALTDALLRQQASDIADLDRSVAAEDQRMMSVVRLLDREAAVSWLSSFISAQPFNCPLAQRSLWVEAIIESAERNRLPISQEILGLVACVVSIESGFRADPLACDPSRGEDMASLLKRAEQELHQKMGILFSVPAVGRLYAEYKDRYYSKLLACRTEGEIEVVARSIADDLKKDSAVLPELVRTKVNKGLDKIANVVRTKGSMQLNFLRARQVMRERGEKLSDDELTKYMYTINGGVDVGVAALKPMFVQYAAHYATPGDLSWLFFVAMDYHYGPFSSRNMMEQIRIRDLSGSKIPIDGDLLQYDEDARLVLRDSLTLRAAMSALPSVSRDKLFRAFALEKHPHYVYTDVHRELAEAHRERFGETPFAVIGELWMGQDAQLKHGTVYKTRHHLNKLDRFLNSIPWDDTSSN